MPLHPDARIPTKTVWILGGIAFLSVGVYIIFSTVFYHFGFPLDDAWIHQTYARNLATRGEWSFLPGQPSQGSTSPFWSILLAAGYTIRLAPYIWTYLLGAFCLWGLAVTVESAVGKMVSSYRPHFPWTGTAMALEWHLVWASASGMETLLFASLCTLVLVMVLAGSRRFFCLGMLIGLSIWIRPEGITLLGPVLLGAMLTQQTWMTRFGALGKLLLGLGSLGVLYLFFNLLITGSPLPNTFYAKQAEYASYLVKPFAMRLWEQGLPILVGVGVGLLPGFVLSLSSAFRRREWNSWIVSFWLIGFVAIYAWKLPVTYQYGRYIIPVLPIFMILGLAGLFEFSGTNKKHLHWIFATAWKLVVAGILVIFWGMGAYIYSRDVAIIESEMVATARWVSTNIPAGDLVAAHDIGALGYFGEHELVDLAGLVSPEVVPFLRDEYLLSRYLTERRVAYLVTFPDWYPELTSGLAPIYSSNAPFAPALQQQNMAVYKWSLP